MKRILIFALLFISIGNGFSQTTQLLGTTSLGGSHGIGTIFKTDSAGENHSIAYSFQNAASGSIPNTALIQANDGMLYGVTNSGGVNNVGVLYQYNPITAVYTKKIDFSGVLNGANPMGELMQASDGMIYGMTSTGGTNDKGVIFQYNPTTSVCVKKFDFTGIADGSNPYGGLMQAGDGMLYGLTATGGINNLGVLFQYNPTNSAFIKKLDFDGSLNGSTPISTLMEASDGMLYGITSSGGANNSGVLFQYNPSNSVYIKKNDFNITDGSSPRGYLMQASDGMLYGTALTGGANGAGVLFQYDLNNSIYTKKVDFDATLNGSNPTGALIQATDGLIYGVTSGGGVNNIGMLFQYDPTTFLLSKKVDFDIPTTGMYPVGSLIQANNGTVYGIANNGGTYNSGVLFQYDISNFNCAGVYNFEGAIDGGYPIGSLLKAADGMLYGMTQQGGLNGAGILFQYNAATSTLVKKFDFGGINGIAPFGSLVLASDGKLYGVTSAGGTNNFGIIFQYDFLTSTFTKKLDFDGPINGSSPYGSLLPASDGMLYGMNWGGGANGWGVIFQYDPISNTCTKKIDLDGTIGGNGGGSMIEGSDGLIYGMTRGGGQYNRGVLFQYNPISNNYVKKLEFGSVTIDGESPSGSLIQANDGKFYGMTYGGGANGVGTLFEYNVNTSVYAKILDFDGVSNGSGPQSSLFQASNGNLYATTYTGGINDMGTMFQYDPINLNYTKKVDFSGIQNGSYPLGDLIETPVSLSTGLVNSIACIGGGLDIPYVIEGVFDAGNIFTAQLSDASGSFSSPISIGSLSSTNPGLINATIPANTPVGSGYRVRVVSSSPYLISGDNGLNILINASSTSSQTITLCAGQSVMVGTSVYSTSGTYTDVLSSVVTGCDSTVTTNLTIQNSIDVSTTLNAETLTATATGAIYQWLDCNNSYAAILNETNQNYIATVNGDYAVAITMNGCTDTSICSSIATIGLNAEVSNYEIKVYPNPAKDVLYVASSVLNEKEIIIQNVIGQVVYQAKSTKQISEIDLKEFKSGVYLVKVKSLNAFGVRKIVIE